MEVESGCCILVLSFFHSFIWDGEINVFTLLQYPCSIQYILRVFCLTTKQFSECFVEYKTRAHTLVKLYYFTLYVENEQSDLFSHIVTGIHTYLGAYDCAFDRFYVSILKNKQAKVFETI